MPGQNKHKIIFLDIDGVLNSERSCIALAGYLLPQDLGMLPPPKKDRNSSISELDPVAVGLLREVINKTGAKIVISSTWRYGADLDYFRSIFAKYEWPDFPVIGMTPSLRKNGASVWRGEEVKAWIDNFELSGENKVTHYICIDDDGDFHPAIPLVQTSANDGFSYRDFEMSLHLLDPENNPAAALARIF